MVFVLIYSIIVPVITLSSLLYTGIEDLRFREVKRDIIWIVMVVLGLIINVFRIIYYNDFGETFEQILSEILLNIFISFLVGFILFYIGAWGGADTKAIWALSILSPVYPLQNYPVNLTPISIPVIDSMVISLIINAGLLIIFYPFILIIKNTILSIKGPLFNEVQSTLTQRIKCFLFGYKYEVKKIKENKIHFDFMEEYLNTEFQGNIESVFKGRLDGKFLGLVKGELCGTFIGKAVGITFSSLPKTYNSLSVEELVENAKALSNSLIKNKKDEKEREIDPIIIKYKDIPLLPTELISDSKNSIINFNGTIDSPIKGSFLGLLEGIVEGDLNVHVKGKLEGDFIGTSSKGKIEGNQLSIQSGWRIKIRTRLDDDEIMEKRQLRTLWQLHVHDKKAVWVTPGVPFVFLMFIGYIFYLLFGNILLLLFTI